MQDGETPADLSINGEQYLLTHLPLQDTLVLKIGVLYDKEICHLSLKVLHIRHKQ